MSLRDSIKDLRNAASHLRRVISVYLLNYDNTSKTKLLRKRLVVVSEVDSASLKKIFAVRDKLFADNHMANMEKLFAHKNSVAKVIETLGLSNFYKSSNFIQVAIVNFFRINKNLSAQFEILDELDADFDTYKNIFPYIADALIQSVAFTGRGKKKCLEIFYRRLGDLRFGYMRFNWDKISEKSKVIFLRWLVEDDLEIFFKIIKQTAVDRMWRYREKFWRAYLPLISSTWIFLGSDAKHIARQLGDKNIGHGILEGGASDQSVFVFQIGRYIFSEWSHNGKLRVYTTESAQTFFGLSSLSKWEINENFIEAWIHSSPRTYSWQKTVSEWLKVNCGVNKTENDWGLED